MGQLVLKRANASRTAGHWSEEGYDLLSEGEVVSRKDRKRMRADRRYLVADLFEGFLIATAVQSTAQVASANLGRRLPLV
jgi:hypothetical protein